MFEHSSWAYSWNVQYPLPLDREVYLCIKGIYANHSAAKQALHLIQTTLKDIPADSIISSAVLNQFGSEQWIVGSVFDDMETAKWWAHFSHRNPTLGKPKIVTAKFNKKTSTNYFPHAKMGNEKRFLTEQEAINLVKKSPDIQQLGMQHKLKFVITDYPRSGDVRYEVEVLKLQDTKGQGVMVDFFMVDAVGKRITERYTDSFKNSRKTALNN